MFKRKRITDLNTFISFTLCVSSIFFYLNSCLITWQCPLYALIAHIITRGMGFSRYTKVFGYFNFNLNTIKQNNNNTTTMKKV